MFVLEIFGTIAFSISGAIEAMKKGMDLLGVLVLGLVTAIGGGVLRDIIIGSLPPTAFKNPDYALLSLLAAFTTFILCAIYSKRRSKLFGTLWNQALLISDAIGLGAFTILGIDCGKEQIANPSTALLLFVGVLTGVGGGVLRDVFAGNVPYIFRKHVYATAAIAGAVTHLYLSQTQLCNYSSFFSLILVVILRILAAHFQWNLPRVRLKE